MPAVSVIITTYNRSALVKEAIESVLRQTLTDFEAIVVDDGSTDDTRDGIKQICDDKVRYFYKENGGVSSARNLGLVNARGEYVAFLDSDDLWPEKYLETMVSNLERKTDYGTAYSLFKNLYPDGRVIDAFGSDRFFSGWLTKRYYKKTPCIAPSASLFRKSVLNNFWWDEAIKYADDIDAFLRISTRTKFLFVPDIYVQRRLTPSSLSYLHSVNLSFDAVFAFERFYFHSGGDKYVPSRVAKRKISRLYRGMAQKSYQNRCRNAAILLFKKTIDYYPFDPKNYKWLLRALLLSKKDDKIPHWQIPKPLPPYITVGEEKIEVA